ncbi:hypothetical protein BaRGS_00013450, partial [Batillaria attramentaria]
MPQREWSKASTRTFPKQRSLAALIKPEAWCFVKSLQLLCPCCSFAKLQNDMTLVSSSYMAVDAISLKNGIVFLTR